MEREAGKMIIGREHVGNYDLLTFKDQTSGLAHEGRVMYFSDRPNALQYALRIVAGCLWTEAVAEGRQIESYDIGACEITLYAENVIGVTHAGDDRILTVTKLFDNRKDAEAYALSVNRGEVSFH